MIRKIFKYFRRLLLLSLAFATALLISTPFYIYDQFNQEIPVARLAFSKSTDFNFTAHLQQGDFCTTRQYRILGDQFQLDAGFIKWNGLGVILGFKPRYRLDRLSGRYSDIALQNNEESLSHDLAPDVLFDFFDENASGDSSGWLMDTSYGSSVYLSIDPSLSYTVYATEDGLITRAETPEEFTRENGELQIEIIQGCAGTPSLFATLSEALNTAAVSALR